MSPPPEPQGTRLTVGEIVRRWNQSPTTVRRHMAAGTLRGAGQVGRGFWSAPIESVVAQYGLEPDNAALPEVAELRNQLAAAEADRADAQHRVEVLEAVTAGQVETIEALRLALSLRVMVDGAERVDATIPM